MSNPKILVGITTYAGDLENRIILRRILRHLRWRNGWDVEVMVISDGLIRDREVVRYADHLLCREGPCGLQQGELDSLRLLADFARARDCRFVVKLAGDVLMGRDRWIEAAVAELERSGRKILSTHWFNHDSWVVGTKFFVAETDFLQCVLPRDLGGQCLELALTRNIEREAPVEQLACLVNSMTGEFHETEGRLAEWQWEHAHRLYKFRGLDADCPPWERTLNRYGIYLPLRILGSLQRELKRAGRRFGAGH